MKKILGIIIVLGLVSAYSLTAQEVKSVKYEVVDLGKGVKLEMVLIPAGKFKMGSHGLEKNRIDDEMQHEVTITNPYYLGKSEVTQEQWEAVMGNNPSKKMNGAKFPVTDVSWEDCKAFIEKMNANKKGDYRLPTESEWEYACRAGAKTAFSVGDKITPKDANYADSNTNRSVAVESYKPNAFGLYDMHGNVWEWCSDWYGSFPNGESIDPNGPAEGKFRVLRGGSFLHFESNARSSFRNYNSPNYSFVNVGFRLAKTK